MEQSKLLTMFDFRQVKIPEKLLELPVENEQVERKLNDLAERFLTIEPVTDTVKPGDIVRLRLPETETLPESVQYVNVGLDFFDPDWERAIVGHAIGDTVTMPKRCKGREGVIESIKRRNVPELTDALVAKLGKEGVTTMEAYRAQVEERFAAIAKQRKQSALINFVMKQTAKASEYADLTEEISARREKKKAERETFAAEEGVSYEEILVHTLSGAKGADAEKLERLLSREAEEDVKTDLIAERLAKEACMVFDRNSYEKEVASYLQMGVPKEDIETQLPYERYLENAPGAYWSREILAYFDNQFKVVKR